MNLLRRKALARDLHGSIQKISENEIEVTIIGQSEETINNFVTDCKKGFKKIKVDLIKERDISLVTKPVKLGFEIINDKKNINKNLNKEKIEKKRKNNNSKKFTDLEIADLKQENKKLREEIDTLKKRNKSITNSASWKITKPLREVKLKLNKIKDN